MVCRPCSSVASASALTTERSVGADAGAMVRKGDNPGRTKSDANHYLDFASSIRAYPWFKIPPSATPNKNIIFALNITRIVWYAILNNRSPLSREAGAAGLGDVAKLVGGVMADQKSRSLFA